MLSLCLLFASAACGGSVLPQRDGQTTETQQIQTDQKDMKTPNGADKNCPDGTCPDKNSDESGKSRVRKRTNKNKRQETDKMRETIFPKRPNLPDDGKILRPRMPLKPVPLPAPKPEI